MDESRMLGLTVRQLHELCERQIDAGNGDKHIIISDDDEGNGFHTLFYDFTTSKKDVEYALSTEHDHTHTVENCIVLG